MESRREKEKRVLIVGSDDRMPRRDRAEKRRHAAIGGREQYGSPVVFVNKRR